MKARENFWDLTGYRLPTDAEWEFAYRAGAGTSRYYGATESLLPRYAWCQDNGDSHTWPVASLKPNDFGLFDMHGNVIAWTYCLFSHAAGSRNVTTDMPNTNAVSDSSSRVLRGGSFTYPASGVRSAMRDSHVLANRIAVFGFRPVRTYQNWP